MIRYISILFYSFLFLSRKSSEKREKGTGCHRRAGPGSERIQVQGGSQEAGTGRARAPGRPGRGPEQGRPAAGSGASGARNGPETEAEARERSGGPGGVRHRRGIRAGRPGRRNRDPAAQVSEAKASGDPAEHPGRGGVRQETQGAPGSPDGGTAEIRRSERRVRREAQEEAGPGSARGAEEIRRGRKRIGGRRTGPGEQKRRPRSARGEAEAPSPPGGSRGSGKKEKGSRAGRDKQRDSEEKSKFQTQKD